MDNLTIHCILFYHKAFFFLYDQFCPKNVNTMKYTPNKATHYWSRYIYIYKGKYPALIFVRLSERWGAVYYWRRLSISPYDHYNTDVGCPFRHITIIILTSAVHFPIWPLLYWHQLSISPYYHCYTDVGCPFPHMTNVILTSAVHFAILPLFYWHQLSIPVNYHIYIWC